MHLFARMRFFIETKILQPKPVKRYNKKTFFILC